VTVDGKPLMKDGKLVKTAAKIEFEKGGPVTFSAARARSTTGAMKSAEADPIVPNSPPNSKWLNPFGPMTSKWGYPLLYTYSLIIALVCGTAGLPHILVRFYTNPDGRSAKRTTLWVMVMLGAFYVFTPMWGVMGRLHMAQLYVNGGFDTAVIKLPTLLENKLFGQILSGVTSAGAFAAFMSTFSGLLVSMSGAFAHDIYGRILKPTASPQDRLKAFKIAAIGVGIVSMGLGLMVETFDIATMVGWAFAIGAASYFPLLLLGSWWKGLTKYGAAAGMLLGGLLSLAAIVTNMLLDKKVLTMDLPPLVRALMEQPAIWGVPLSIITMIVVSKATKDKLPSDVTWKMLKLHAPEEMGLSKDYIEA
jgi:Na+(H+)/acetate symporter ActP